MNECVEDKLLPLKRDGESGASGFNQREVNTHSRTNGKGENNDQVKEFNNNKGFANRDV